MEVESIKVTSVFLSFSVLQFWFISLHLNAHEGNGRGWYSSVQRLQSGNSFHMSNQVSSVLDISLLSFWGNWLWGSFFLIYARLSHVRIGPIDCDGATHLRKDSSHWSGSTESVLHFLLGVNSSRGKQNPSSHKGKPVCVTMRSTFKTTLLKGNSSLSSLGNILFTIQEGFTLTDKIS